jgi:hypothetical protein
VEWRWTDILWHVEAAEEVISVGDMLNRSSATTYASQYGKVLFKAFFFWRQQLVFWSDGPTNTFRMEFF